MKDSGEPRLAKVAIVGRPNVGKSTLFNRIVGWRKALVFKESGTTRDRLYEPVNWSGKNFWLVDTGGLSYERKDELVKLVEQGVRQAIKEADILVFLVDGQTSVAPLDERIAEDLRRAGKPVLLAVNKIDDPQHEVLTAEFYRLGFGKPFALSALHGKGTETLLDAIVEKLPSHGEQPSFQKVFRLTLIGEPNTGKSTFFNSVLGKYRSIVSPVAGTTRDFIEEWIQIENGAACLTDTGGIQKRKRFPTVAAYLSAIRSRRVVEWSDVVLLFMDAVKGPQRDTRMLFELVEAARKACVIVVNKWDLVRRVPQAEYTKALRQQFHYFKFSPVVYISALRGKDVQKPLQEALKLWKKHSATFPEKELNAACEKIKKIPAFLSFKLKYLSQVETRPPHFILFLKNKRLVTTSQKRFMENFLIQTFELQGVPVRLELKEPRAGEK